ncbi:MAG: DUF1566 domain-containing protein [Desulfobacterales bacterium]|nr:DUF1566 domain-containing protein [Desulfobacterales bacterium]
MFKNTGVKDTFMGYRRKSIWLVVVWLGLIQVPAHILADDSQRDLYYSVHVDTAGDIETVNRKINHLTVTGKIIFWQQREIKGVGKYYKVYLGWFEDFKPARRFMRKLQQAGWKKSMTVHWFKYPPWEQKRPVEGDANLVREKALLPPPPQVAMVDRFIDNGDGTVTDQKTGLMWIKNGWQIEFIAAVPWHKAMEKCADFRAGNHTDWRLPTVEEWRSLVDRSVSYPALVEPNPFKNIITHMPYWSRTEYAYGEKPVTGSAGTRDSYTVMLYSGSFNHQRKTERAFILPVRNVAR